MSAIHPCFDPIPNPEAVVVSGNARFVVLTDRLIRMELDPQAKFEDRPSLTYWVRRCPPPRFTVSSKDGWLLIETDFLNLHFYDNNRFHWRDLWIELKQSGKIWRYGDEDHHNLGGTTRTLDSVVGALDLDPGLVSRSGWAVVDDSRTPILDENGLPLAREKPLAYKDLYFYGYAQDYLAAVKDHQRFSGKPSLLPRWALGNWWSRYWAYSSQELLDLMDDFQAHQIPLSVCIVDMDWHKTKTNNSSSGWTGYSWNRELFPDPEEFIRQLHRRELKTALNLHPAEGIHPHEDNYPEMAKRMGIDPATSQAIPFDIADPVFCQAYFEVMHHPLERQGVDFWWLDWQQGSRSAIAGLDPLFWLNHLHYYDQGKSRSKRPFIFSRWPGLGGQRYPIGFSGDTVVHWESLAFQIPMTATASNVGYGWWSHDIGGHTEGTEQAELYLRWVQFGVFSPIFRLHSTNNPFIDRRPWAFDLTTLKYARQAMQLRRQLIPILYTANQLNAESGEPAILPMYYGWNDNESAYQAAGQYRFCRQMLVAPVTTPLDPDTGFARKLVWLPEGDWFDAKSHEHLDGGFWYSVYAGLEDIPIFVQPGAILPLDAEKKKNGTALPDEFKVKIFAGKDSDYSLYEDEGEGQAYLDGEYCFTKISQKFTDNRLSVRVEPAEGQFANHLPAERVWDFEIAAITQPARISCNHELTEWSYNEARCTLSVRCQPLKVSQPLELVLEGVELKTWQSSPIERVSRFIAAARIPSQVKREFTEMLPTLLLNPSGMFGMAHRFTRSQLLAIYESLIPATVEKPAEDLYNAFEEIMAKMRKLQSGQSGSFSSD